MSMLSIERHIHTYIHIQINKQTYNTHLKHWKIGNYFKVHAHTHTYTQREFNGLKKESEYEWLSIGLVHVLLYYIYWIYMYCTTYILVLCNVYWHVSSARHTGSINITFIDVHTLYNRKICIGMWVCVCVCAIDLSVYYWTLIVKYSRTHSNAEWQRNRVIHYRKYTSRHHYRFNGRMGGVCDVFVSSCHSIYYLYIFSIFTPI